MPVNYLVAYTRLQVQAALQSLPSELLRVVEAVMDEGFSIRGAAQKLGRPYATIYARWGLALRLLYTALQHDDYVADYLANDGYKV